eukprot:m.78067 g.78067  ORF g.78067 m.78067 type:complete len:142 (+) comp20720_c0_seq3:61-486(+)
MSERERGRECVKQLHPSCVKVSCERLAELITQIKPELWQIFKGKVFSARHQQFKGTAEERRKLKYKMQLGSLSDDQEQVIVKGLTKIFCKKGAKYLTYVMDVLLPETLIRIFMHVLQVPYESAEELLETAVFGHEDVDVDD